MRSHHTIAVGFLLFLVVSVLCYVIYHQLNESDTEPSADNITISSYTECVNAGYPISEIYPPFCTTPNGDTFIDDTVDLMGAPNFASVYCEKQGGFVDIREVGDGQVGYCVFVDGSECEEWEFYYGRCTEGYSIQ